MGLTIPTIGIRAVDEKSARRPKYPSNRNRTHRVRIGRCVWQRSSQKILEVSCGTRDECDP
ncbi:hypothetical protein YC2023_082826 [Brassica napus]